MKKLSENKTSPKLLNIYKPEGISSFDVIRKWKPKLRDQGKIGHFGTLDPFASGVLILGVNGAQRLNNYIHDFLPKKYLAIGVLGKETETGDLTVAPSQFDNSDFFNNEIPNFSIEFIESKLNEQFLGEYLQAPHKYSAAKYEGKALHKWAREGITIKKEKKLRYIHSIKVMNYSFPNITIEFEVSSGTYIRTLFSECANYLGTLGVLERLIRTEIGACTSENAIKEKLWNENDHNYFDVDSLLDFSSLILSDKELNLYKNGVRLKCSRSLSEEMGSLTNSFRWVKGTDHKIIGLAEIVEDEFHSRINFN